MTNLYPASEFSSKPDVSEVKLLSPPSGENDFAEYWSNSTLGREVLEGRKLRNEKPKYLSLPKQYDVVNVNYTKSPCNGHRRRKPAMKKHIKDILSPRFDSSLSRSSTKEVPCPAYNTKIYKFPRKKRKYRRRCPLRVAELAVPSKRHCLDTWRNNYAVLPDYMVERLKQQVLDQKPIVQISDAIYCFKSGKCFQSKKCYKKTKNGCSRKHCVTDTEALCAIFGHKIALHLNKPMAIVLSPRLQNISDIIAQEMTYLIKKKICMNKVVNHRILNEMAGKITIWVEMILDESNYKFQEDQLCDLEEEFGSILDLIDDLMENVLDICTPDSLDYIMSHDGESKESVLEEQFEESSSSALSLSEEINAFEESDGVFDEIDKIDTEQEFIANEDDLSTYLPEDYNRTSISSYLRNEIYVLINNIEKEIKVDLDETYFIDLDKEEHNSIPEVLHDIEKDKYLDSSESQPENENPIPNPEDIESQEEKNYYEYIGFDNIQTDLPRNNSQEQKENIDESVEENVRDAPQTFAEEQDDDTNKKVKFSDINIGIGGQLEIHSDTHLLDPIFDKKRALSKSSSDNFKSNINFAPPNENLLSEADESWPENIPSPGLRPSESISRSITSLGKILETEEKNPISSESDDAKKNKQESDKILDKSELMKVEPKIDKEEIKSKKRGKKKNEPVTQDVKKEKVVESNKPRKRSSSRDSSKPPDTRKPAPKSIEKLEKRYTASTVPKDKNRHSRVKDRLSKSDVEKSDRKRASKTDKPIKIDKSVKKKHTSPHEETEIKKIEIDKKKIESHTRRPKRDCRVNEKTAPSWFHRKRVESHKDLTHEINQYEIRKWCRDLLHEFERFQMWNDWLKCMCRNFACMYQCQGKLYDYKRWLNFKRNVDKNIATWVKLNRRAHHKLNKTIYICVKVSEVSSPRRNSSRCLGRNTRSTQSTPHCSTFTDY